MDRITENILFIINNPQQVRNKFVAALNDGVLGYGCEYDTQKTVSTYVDPYQAVIVTQTTVQFISQAFSYPKGEHFLITAIRGYTAANATLASSAWVAGLSDALTINGTWTVTNNGTVELKTIPWTVFQPASNFPDAGLFILPKPIMWKAQTNLGFVGNWVTAPTTANQNARIELIGIKLI